MRLNHKRSLVALLALLTTAGQSASIRELTQTPSAADIKISPDGRYLAVLAFAEDKHVLLFLDRASLQAVGKMEFTGLYEPWNFRWANNERVVGSVAHVDRGSRRASYGELFAVNFDGSDARFIFGVRASDPQTGTQLRGRTADRAWGEIVDVLSDDDRHILVSVTPFSESLDRPPSVELLDIYAGTERRAGKASRYGLGAFYTDRLGEIRFVTSISPEGLLHAEGLPRTDGDWVDIPHTLLGGFFRPVAVSADLTSIYALDNRGNDKVGLHSLSLDGGSYTEVFSHERVDVTDAYLSTDGKSVYAVRVDDGYPKYILFSESHEEAAVLRTLLTAFPGRVVDITSRTTDGRYWIARAASDVDTGAFYLYDKESGNPSLLLEVLPKIDEADLVSVEPIEFESFDGTRVAGYFARGKPIARENPPLVVLLHDGPRERDYWRYDANVQALAMSGFSVLQINYRGSSGYGRAFRDAGNRQWADGIPRDIIAGTKWAIEQGKAETGRVCTMGAGFGAYAALVSVIRDSELFACAVARAGIYDLELLGRPDGYVTPYTEEAYLDEVIGRNEEDLERASPVNLVARLDVPVLIAHEESEGRIPFEHARRLREKLDQHDKEYVWLESSRSGFYDQEVEVEFLETALEFLTEHAGATR
jgi:dipeptidyl aminopeptidase/acylaminoacyl peptidase